MSDESLAARVDRAKVVAAVRTILGHVSDQFSIEGEEEELMGLIDAYAIAFSIEAFARFERLQTKP